MPDAELVPRRGLSSLEPALVALGVVLAALTALETHLVAVSQSEPLAVNLMFPATAVVYAVAGLAAWRRRPANRIGPLLVVGSLIWLAASLYNVDPPGLVAVGLAFSTVSVAFVVHLLLAFPSGRLPSRTSTVVVVAAYLTVTVLQAPLYLFWAAPPPYDVLTVSVRPDLVDLGHQVQRSSMIAVALAFAAILGRRLARATPDQRRVLLPLFGYGTLAVVLIPVTAHVLVHLIGVDWLAVTQVLLLAGVPLAFFLSLQRGAFRPTGDVDQLAVWLGAEGDTRPDLVEALAGTLGDPSLRLTIDDGTDPVAPSDGRGQVEIELGGRRVGVISYDATLIDDPEPVRQAGRVVALAVDRERLTHSLRASRARIAQAGDLERRRIAADLHDGLQATLVMLAMRAYAIEEEYAAQPPVSAAAAALRHGLDEATGTLRRLVHGVMPTLLIERGLFTAAEELTDQMPLPTRLTVSGGDQGLTDHVQSTAYFALAEALTNAVKHAGATRVEVELRRGEESLTLDVRDDGVGGAEERDTGSGLRSLADRLDAVGGRLTVHSPPGGGTLVRAELPCGS